MSVNDWWNRKPSPKTPEEIEWDKLGNEYEESFGERLGLGYGRPETIEEAMAIMRECLRTGVKYEKEPWNWEKNANIIL